MWAIPYQTVGGAIAIPLYYLAWAILSSKSNYHTSGRALPLSFAKALLPALVLGYLVPTIAMYLPIWSFSTLQSLVAYWQVCPIVVNILLFFFSNIQEISGSESTNGRSSKSTTADVYYLNLVYGAAVVVPAITHIGICYITFTSTDPTKSFSYVFTPDSANAPSTLSAGLHFIFQWDYYIIFASTLVWALLAVTDLKRLGVTNVGLVQASLILTLMSFFTGPASATACIWWWREGKLAEVESMLVSKSKAS